MRNVKIVLVAQWDGWCGACAAERPLVLTRTGRQRVRTWLTAAADDSRPLVLTCRLCGTAVDVPLERDDPAVVVSAPARELHLASASAAVDQPDEPAGEVVLQEPVQVDAAVTAGREAVARALGGLVAQRAAEAAAPAQEAPTAPLSMVKTPTVAPALPVQRTATTGGLAELQLLADGIDLLSTGRA